MAVRKGVLGVRATAAAIALPLALTAACGSSDDSAKDPGDASTGPSSMSASGSVAPSPTTPPASGSTSAAPRPAPASWPTCTAVWKEGAKLPAHYKGCADQGMAVDAHQLACESGQAFVLYAEHFWAVRGGTIHHASRKLANSPAYTADVATCRG